MYPGPTTTQSLLRQKTQEILKGHEATQPVKGDHYQSEGEPFPGSSEWFTRSEEVQLGSKTKS